MTMTFENQMAADQIAVMPTSEIIHRLPPMRISPMTFSAEQLDERIPWGLQSNQIPDVWQKTLGAGVKVAILDTGQANHFDLPDPLFVENFSRSPTPIDMQGHATHVAGTLGARKNGVGVVGVAPEVGIGYCKVLGDDGSGTSTAIARGIYSAMQHGVDIISMSLGSPQNDQRISQACFDAVQAGVLVICAGGNDGQLIDSRTGQPVIDPRTGQPVNTIGYPARLSFTVAIAAYNRDGRVSEFSSRGPEIDAAFPGEDILSTWPGGGFKSISGTSMATPFAAGLVALRLAYQRAFPAAKQIRNNEDLKAELKATAKDQGPVGHDNDWGWGIPDANGFVRGGHVDPPPPPPVVDPVDPTVPVVPGPGAVIGPFRFDWPVQTVDGRSGLLISLEG